MYFDMTSWSHGVAMGTIKSSDGVLNNGSFRFDTPLVIANDVSLALGSSSTSVIRHSTTGLDTMQLGVLVGNASYSGAVAIYDYSVGSAANRSPGISHSNPNLYVYRAGSASANDFIRTEHDGTYGNIVSGGTSGILIQPGSGVLGISGGISASGATFSGNISAPNIVTSFNGATGAITYSGYSTNSTTQTLNFSENNDGLEIVFYDLGQDLFTSLRYVENNKTITASIGTDIDAYVGVIRSIKSFYDALYGWSARLILVPAWDIANATAETILAENIVQINLNLTSYSGTNVVDSWTSIASALVYHQEETYVVKTVTGQTWVAADSYIICNVLGITTADHTPEDAILESVKFNINNIVAGTGFDIIGHAPEGTYGKYTVKCLGQ
jgi:hypothetical protein